MKEIKVDAMGDQCPIPVIKTKKALDKITEQSLVEVHVDNEIAVQNLSKMAKQKNLEYTCDKIEDQHYVIKIKAEANNSQSQEVNVEENKQEEVCYPDRKTNTVVVLSSNKMGEGNDELGQILMKGFIFALTELEELPSTVLLYNSGVKLSTEGSNSIKDLKTLEAQGVEILSCGTCLNYYNLTEKLEVGEVTNMYFILEKMAQADKIIRP
ncbi:sulfurtransferase-like selenium metabolism protein YedF [Intestinibacter bartlettii]|uniref:Sulfurtransferase-like selenium metabolism protein YedF n=1 Tax=Intestinibacter bartlettii TaxID=261299 RepID=A0ABS6DWI5_9FIRM|nr:sulfurtransferase-like selenium metabolism protein YedF [Intestinibacter bartlettii]MBU5336206.1 sulfurtransferase-like selenium metabolism protein YedF [Intestinibacter bartlettii]